MNNTLLGLALMCLLLAAKAAFADGPLADGFRNVPPEARMRMYWRVFGPAWSPPEIDYELKLLRDAGVGGVTVYFMYPVALDDPAQGIVNQRFGSPEFLQTFAYAAASAQRLGLRFGLNGSTGWPFGGPTVKGLDAAQRLYEKTVPSGRDLALEAGERLLAAFEGGKHVTAQVRGAKTWPRALKLYVTGPTGMQVKRAAYGAEGSVLSHFDTPALERYLAQVVDPILTVAPGGLNALGCDSLEVYDSNWTADLPREFRRRRGYGLLPCLPELFAKPGPVRFDFWRTLAELTEERFTKPLGAWAQRHGLALEMEAYGTPPNPMTAARYIHVPTGEHYEWKGFSVQKYVASAANLAGRPIIGSEAWTWAGLPNRLADSLSDIKLVSDMAFVAGANDLTGVDFPYSPRSAGSPGWQPYYGPTMNQNNPQWEFFPALVAYLNRCQWMLRQGKPVRNVAVYLPVEDALENGPAEMMLLDFLVRDRFVTGKATSEFGLKNALKHHSDLLHGLISHGYDYDGIDFWAMNRLAKVRGRSLAAGDGRYRAIVLPNLETMDLESARKVVEFWRAGGAVIASRRAPSRAAGTRGDAELRDLMAEMFGSRPSPGAVVASAGGGKAMLIGEDRQIASALAAMAVEPDVRYSTEPSTVGYVHRRTKDADVYFFLNVGPGAVEFSPSFAGRRRRIELWDPLTGGITVPDSGGPLTLRLPPRGSMFVVLGCTTKDATPALDGGSQRTIELTPKWHVSFEGPDAPQPVEVSRLVSWTELPGGRYFSGVASYSATLEWSGEKASRVWLRFNEAHEAASVTLNGQARGVVFGEPWEFDITSALRKGANRLEIRVGNLIVNRFIGQPDVDLKPLRAVYGARFGAPEEKQLMKEPAPSGLIGKVWLVTAP